MGERRGYEAESDAGLAERAKQGDNEAFSRLAARHQAGIYALCRRWTGSHCDAEDLAQETLLKAHRHLGQLEQPERFAAWLKQIAANLCRNWLAREKRDIVSLDALEQEPALTSPIFDPSSEQASVQEAMSAVPPELRLALQLFYLHGFTQKELAALWQLPESTIKGRLDAGRRVMRKELEKMGVLPEQHTTTREIVIPDPEIVVACADRRESKTFCDALRTAGFSCTVIARGDLILSRLSRRMPGLFIFHVPFRGLDEFEVLRAIRQNARLRHIEVMFLVPKETATEAHMFKGWHCGVNVYLTKPYVMEEVIRFARRLADQIKGGEYAGLAVEYAWHQETPQTLYCLAKARELGGREAVEAIREDPAFNYLRHTEAFQRAVPPPVKPTEE